MARGCVPPKWAGSTLLVSLTVQASTRLYVETDGTPSTCRGVLPQLLLSLYNRDAQGIEELCPGSGLTTRLPSCHASAIGLPLS